MLHLQRLETTLSVCAEEPDHSQLFTHLGRMALEFNRLASKVHKNEQRTSILQVRPGPGKVAGGLPCGSPSASSSCSGESRVPRGLPRVRMGTRLGLLVQGSEQGKEVVRRAEEEAGNREIMVWVVQISWLGLLSRLGCGRLAAALPLFFTYRWGKGGDRGRPLVCYCPCPLSQDHHYPHFTGGATALER